MNNADRIATALENLVKLQLPRCAIVSPSMRYGQHTSFHCVRELYHPGSCNPTNKLPTDPVR